MSTLLAVCPVGLQKLYIFKSGAVPCVDRILTRTLSATFRFAILYCVNKAVYIQLFIVVIFSRVSQDKS